MNSSLQVAVVQLTSGEDVEANADRILEFLSHLEAGVDLVCLPENALFLRGSKSTPIVEIRLSDPAIQRLSRFADERDCGILVGSIPHREDDRLYNAMVFLEPKRAPRVVYRKVHLFDVDVPGAPPSRESETFAYGPTPATLDWRGWKIGLTICYDVRFSELYRSYAAVGVDLIVIPSAFLVPTGMAHWDILVRARAIESQAFVAAAAQGGEHLSRSGEKRYTYGHSMIVGPWGEKRLELSEEQRVGIVKLEKSELEKVRRQIPMQDHRTKRRWETI